MEAKELVGRIRTLGKLTQVQVAERCGIPQPTISKIERGEVNDVMSRNYRALLALLAELQATGPVALVSAHPVAAAGAAEPATNT